jgi:hypothetical protein
VGGVLLILVVIVLAVLLALALRKGKGARGGGSRRGGADVPPGASGFSPPPPEPEPTHPAASPAAAPPGEAPEEAPEGAPAASDLPRGEEEESWHPPAAREQFLFGPSPMPPYIDKTSDEGMVLVALEGHAMTVDELSASLEEKSKEKGLSENDASHYAYLASYSGENLRPLVKNGLVKVLPEIAVEGGARGRGGLRARKGRRPS